MVSVTNEYMDFIMARRANYKEKSIKLTCLISMQGIVRVHMLFYRDGFDGSEQIRIKWRLSNV